LTTTGIDTDLGAGDRVEIQINKKPAKCGADIHLPGEE
jgi:hypothetical protein